MLRYGKSPGALLLAGIAAFAYYKYNKMSPDQKKDLVNGLKEKGKKIFGQFIPGQDAKAQPATNTANGYNFSEGNQYTG
ncbi:MAG: hypothetical protein WCF67_12125 [Chitinophagaceae bacterium]